MIVSIEGCADYVEGSTTRWEIKNTSWKTKAEIGRCFKIRSLKQLSERESCWKLFSLDERNLGLKVTTECSPTYSRWMIESDCTASEFASKTRLTKNVIYNCSKLHFFSHLDASHEIWHTYKETPSMASFAIIFDLQPFSTECNAFAH